MTKQRRTAALLCALFLFALSAGAASHEELLFVAAENMVLPLAKDDMPFFHEGYLYISSEIFTGNVKDALGVSAAKIGDGVLLYRGERSLLFRGHYAYAQDSEQNTYAPGMIWRDDGAYVPAAVVARYFDLLYSATDVAHGKLVWLRNPSFSMKEKAFAKAATSQLNAVYQEYLRTLEPEAPPEPESAPPEESEEPGAQEDFSDFSAPEAVTGPPSEPASDDGTPYEPASDDGTRREPASDDVTPREPASDDVTPREPASGNETPHKSAWDDETAPAPILPESFLETPNPAAPVETPVTPSVSAPATPPKSVTPSASGSKTVRPSGNVSAPSAPNSVAPSGNVSAPSAPSGNVSAPSAPNSVAPSAPDSPTVTPDDSPPPDSPSDSSPAPRGEQTIYLCLRADDAAPTLLDALDRRRLRATLFCDETFLAEQGDFLRRVTATGYRVGLYVPSGPSASVLARLETCNLLLQRTTMEKTRLAFIDGAGEETLRAVRNAGFVCLNPDVNFDGASLRASRQAADLLKLVWRHPESVSVWLSGGVSRSGLNAFLNDALELDDAFLPWTEGALR